jgi:hypothetical protein
VRIGRALRPPSVHAAWGALLAMNLEIDNFVATLRHSGLMHKVQVDDFLRDLGNKTGHAELTVDSLIILLISSDLLTPWQAGKLKDNRYKGFYLDDYLLLDRLEVRADYTRYLSRHLPSSQNVVLRVFRPEFPNDQRGIRFEVESVS